jgi:hypothetical protein
MERVLKCPQCNGPLAPSRFARSVACPYCGATVQLDEVSVSAAAYREAFRVWNSPATHGYGAWLSLGDSHWAPGALLAHGEISDVYEAKRARWPSEHVVLKVLRERSDLSAFEHEWEVLQGLQRSTAPAEALASRVPEPVVRGEIEGGAFAGSRAMIFRWPHGFAHTFEAVGSAYPKGVDPRASIWVWRRILEVLSFVHASGIVHGAVLPRHLLVQRGEHGVRLVGFSCAERVGGKLRAMSKGFETFYPPGLAPTVELTLAVDLVMSARCVAVLLGGEAATGGVPARVPPPLAAVIRRVANVDVVRSPAPDAWALREELGAVASAAFGPPAFCPIAMPG